MLDGRGREACERRQGREISHRMKAPPKGPIMFGPLRRLPLGQPTELGVDRLGDSNGRHHHEHNKSKPGPREVPGAPLCFKANIVAATPAITPRIGIIGSTRNRDRRKSTAYWSMGIRRHRLVRSTAKIKIPPAQRPQETNIIQALICAIVMRYTFSRVGA
jgi:hypothetical protein